MRIDEIAKKAGVAKSTVSYVLNNTKNVSPKTRDKILKVCEKYNFKPNFYSKLLSNKKGTFKTNLVALFLPTEGKGFHHFYNDLISSVFVYLESKGYGLILYSGKDFSDVINKVSLGQAPIDGAIVMSPHTEDERVLSLSNAQIPVVIIGNGEKYNLHYVDTNNKNLVKDVTIKMINAGYKKISLINSVEQLTISQDRALGFYEAYQEVKAYDEHDCMYYDEQNESLLHDYIVKSIEEGKTGFITSNGRVAMKVYDVCNELNKVVGKDISVFSLGYSYEINKEDIVPSLSYASQNYNEIGEISSSMVTKLIDGEEPSNILVESIIHSNESFNF